MNPFNRRDFLKLSTSTLAVAAGNSVLGNAHAMQPIKRPGKPRLATSLAAYSFREFFRFMRGKENAKLDAAKEIDMLKFIDYCADQGIAGAELTSYFFPADAKGDYMLKVRRQAFMRGVIVSGTAVGNNFARPKGEELSKEIASVKEWIDHAALMSAPHIRVFAGAPAKGMDAKEARNNCIESLEECCEYAGKKGIVLGLENHGGIVTTADQLLDIVAAVKSPWFGVNLDTGNFQSPDPYADLARCAPYAVNVQIKAELGPSRQEQYPADLKRLVKMLRNVNYQGFVVLEYEAKESPWTAVPRLLGELKELCA